MCFWVLFSFSELAGSSREDRRDAGIFAVMIGVIWRRLLDWFLAREDNGSDNVTNHPDVWCPPMEGWLECNIDTSFNSDRGATNRDWCVRDHLSSFIFGVA
ncbi:unnamed protein product [Vicia faba]|uniref:Secreted protein n=1 Tax=Vicia faba TaxID=3906 RepID=A0AAV1A1Y3_VICFA|nr:unnamed protein product [Vicia faba]